MKIAFVIRQLGSTGGVERRLEQLYSSNLNKEFEIVTFSFFGILETYHKESRWLAPFKFLYRLVKLILFLTKEKPDIIHAFDLESLLYSSIAKKLLLKNKLTLIGSYGAEKVHDIMTQKLLSYAFFYPSIFVCNSKNGKNSLLNITKNKVPVKVIFNGFTPTDINIPSNKPSWYDDNKKYVGVISKFDDYKKAMRVFDIVDAMPEEENISFVIAGTGRDYQLAQLRFNGNERYKNRIILLGVVQDAWKLIPWFDMGLLVSDSEGFPTVLIEFLSLKKTILSTKCGESPFILNSGKAGLLEPEFNAQVFAKHIQIECVKGKLNISGYNWYKNNFSFEIMLDKYKALYNSNYHVRHRRHIQ